MRAIFAVLMLCAVGGGCWYGWRMANMPADNTVVTQADNFANAALTALYNASSSEALASTSPITTAQDTLSNTPSQRATTSSPQVINYQNYMHATLHTSMGDISIEFFNKDAPNTVANFKKLAASNF